MGVGQRAFFAEIAYRLVQKGDERTIWSWYSADRSTMLSILSIPLQERRTCRGLPYFDGENPVVDIRLCRRGVVLNSRRLFDCIGPAVAQVALLFAVTHRLVHLRIHCADSTRGEALLLSLQKIFIVDRGFVIKLLFATEFSALVGRYKRRSGCTLDALGNVESLVLSGSREVDATLTGVCYLKGLNTLNIANSLVSSLFPIRALQNLVDIDASGTKIYNPDVVVLSQLLRLRRLILDNCKGLTSIAPLAGHSALKILSTMHCVHLRIIGALCSIPSLRFVDLSFTSVPPGELLRFLGGVGALVDLRLDGLRMPVVEIEFAANEHLYRLSINGMRTMEFNWVCTLAPFLQRFFLDGTDITGKQMADIGQLLPFLEEISLVRCFFLRSSFSWALTMENLSHVIVSRHSVADDNVIGIMRQREVNFQIVC